MSHTDTELVVAEVWWFLLLCVRYSRKYGTGWHVLERLFSKWLEDGYSFMFLSRTSSLSTISVIRCSAGRECYSRSRLLSATALQDRYRQLTGNEEYQRDNYQQMALLELERLRNELLQTEPRKLSSVPRGVYLHGGVGCGKTFCMNIFANSLAGTTWDDDVQLVHFHAWMLGIHELLHRGRLNKSDTFSHVIQSILNQGRLLCLDEFQITDIADAMILQRLFTSFWNKGGILVTTSNRPPNKLFPNVLDPLVRVLPEHCEIVSMEESTTDYREYLLEQEEPTNKQQEYFFEGPAGLDTLDQQWRGMGQLVGPQLLANGTRFLSIPQATPTAARFTFAQLSDRWGASDYIRLTQQYDLIVVEQVPPMSINELNALRRFIVLVDVLYESNTKLWLHTVTHIDDLVTIPQPAVHDEFFAWQRTRSRLQEMETESYGKQNFKVD